jgi:glycosyltransferase involved in cell wall biosynthesis
LGLSVKSASSLLSLFNWHGPSSDRRRAGRVAPAGKDFAGTGAGAGRNGTPVVWFEVEDFLRYFDHFSSPTGLQRVPFEIYIEADRLYGHTGSVRFCRLSAYTKRFHEISFDTIVAAYLNPPGANAPWRTIWAPARFWGQFSKIVPLVARHPRFFYSILKTAVRDLVGMRSERAHFERQVRRGDIIVSLGAGWGVPNYIKHIAEAKRRYGVKFAMLIHDLIPIEYDSLVEPHHVVQFRNWLQQAIPVTDVALSVSKHSRDALIRLGAEAGWALPPIEIVPPGSGVNERLLGSKPAPLPEEQKKLNLPPRYVLFVSTIEIRKNHRLLVRVWRRLIERHGADAVPALVFAGQIGWLVDDLLAELAASQYLDGKIVLLPGSSDAQLRQAYRSSLFTVFPSLCEGWGLPIAESLMHGKFCVASNRTSIPEVGGDLIDYFDPANEDDALAKIERLLLDPGYLRAREARLQTEYRPRAWADCVQDLVGACGLAQ